MKEKQAIGIMVLVGILVILLGAVTVYSLNLRKKRNEENSESIQKQEQISNEENKKEEWKKISEFAKAEVIDGKEVSIDLDNDGNEEKITLGEHGDILINGKNSNLTYGYEKLYIVKIEDSEDKYEIVGASRTNGVNFTFYEYKDYNLKEIGYIWVGDNKKPEGELLKFNGKGKIQVYDFLTDLFEEEINLYYYKYEDGQLKVLTPDAKEYIGNKYVYNPNGDVCLIKDINNIKQYYAIDPELLENKEKMKVLNEKYGIIELNQKVVFKIIGIEDNALKVELDDGTEGYLVRTAYRVYGDSQ